MSSKSSALLVSLLFLMIAIATASKSYEFFSSKQVIPPYLTSDNCSEITANSTLSCEDLPYLTERERLLSPYEGLPRFRSARTVPSDRYDFAAWSNSAPYEYFGARGVPIVVSDALEPPEFHLVSDVDRGGSIAVTNGSEVDQVYFEFDLDESFSSPQLWRWPALKPVDIVEDRHAPVGSHLDLFNFASASTSGLAREIELPFPLAFMAVPYSQTQPLLSMQKLVALASREAAKRAHAPVSSKHNVEVARMLHRYVQHTFLIGSDSYNKAPVETFLARNGECGNLNSMVQLLVELAGMPARLVAGFSPELRQIMPFSGHTLLEVKYSEGWGILDTYLDIFEPSVSTARLGESYLADKVVLGIDNTLFDSDVYGDSATLGRIFSYRRYGDGADRMPMQSHLQLGGEHAEYGLDWAFRVGAVGAPESLLATLPSSIQVYIRARFVRSRCIGRWNYSCGDPEAEASRWVVRRITLKTG